jgi:hypothetical protein
MTTTPETIAELKRLLALDAAGLTTYSEACAWRRTRAVLPLLMSDLEAAQKREQVLREALDAIMDDNGRHYHIDPHLAAQARAALAATEAK